MRAVVMAGGEGSRLRPITRNRPKPLVPVCNEPIMAHILALLKRHEITQIVTTLHYLGDEIQGFFGDGTDYDVQIKYSTESVPLGTAGSVKKAESLLQDDTFLIISGDALTDCDLTKAIEFHRSKGSVATLVLCRVPNPLEFGVVITDEEGRVVRFHEKPGWSEVFSDTVNTGMYILEPEVFDLMDPDKVYDWSSDIFPKLLADGRPMYGYVMDEYWADVGSLNQYHEAQEDMLSGRINLPVQGEALEPGGISIAPNCSIDKTATLVPPLCIGRNCKIKKNARVGPYAVIGDNCFVEEGAHVDRSVLWDSVYIGPGVGVHSAIVCSHATVKKDSVIREEAVVGDRCLIDANCTIRPRVKLWPDKIVERGATVTMSLVWGSKWHGSLFRDIGVAGLSNIEITPDFACRLGSAFGSCFSGPTRIVTSRDSTKSSRMIKRALISSLLSVGCDVLDLRSAALPVARHFIKTSGASAAMNVRKLPGNNRVSLIEMFDSRGAYLPKSLERKVETAFFREDFRRTDPDDLGVIEFASRAIEEYQADYFRCLTEQGSGRRLRIVCDYGYSSLSGFFPAMLERINVDSIALNGFNDSKRAPRTEDEIQSHVKNLSNIVGTLGYDMGVLFTQEGERLTIIDERGLEVVGNTLFGVLGTLIAKTHKAASVALSVTAPRSLENAFISNGLQVIRTKADVRSLMSTSLDAGVTLAGDDLGGFIFPELHPGFDAAFSLGKIISMLQQTGLTLSEVVDDLPKFEMAYQQVTVPWDAKGQIMRQISEENDRPDSVDHLDGIKIFDEDSWVLVLPDPIDPSFHIYAESPEHGASVAKAQDFARKIELMLARRTGMNS